MDNPQKQQIAERLKTANNILVTVSANPSVDQLSACIGLTLALNKLGKHATAVFSGQVPSTIEFLQPEKTLEKNTDSLRDFIIALDKSKADKLRYKVEDKVVKIFITPYKTSISEKDLEFSQGDFNVDVVLALGVHNQADLDQAITAHGRILHDAVVATINVKPGGDLGTLNWLEPAASSLSELSVELIDAIDKKIIDGQMATSFLTGIVAETGRFGNAKTSPQTMSISAELMTAGANQQLVATKLEPKPAPPPVAPEQPKPIPEAEPAKGTPGPLAMPNQTYAQAKAKDEGTLEIDHKPDIDLNAPADDKEPETLTPQIDIDREGTLRRLEERQLVGDKPAAPGADPTEHISGSRMVLQPPTLGGQLSANVFPSSTPAPGGDPLSLPPPGEPDQEERPSGAPPLAPVGGMPSVPSRGPTITPPSPLPTPDPTPPSPASPADEDDGMGPLPPPAPITPPPPTTDTRTLTDIEKSVGSPHLEPTGSAGIPGSDLNSARDAVNQAINSQPPSRPLGPIAALNAQPLDLPLRDDTPGAAPQAPDPNAPPPLPPPMMPPAG